jgi:ribA/ribD-fused uncharacterized protein
VSDIIKTFHSPEHRFLSNFWPCTVWVGGLTYRSSEAAYQAQKCADPADQLRFTLMQPGEAKRAGKHMHRPDWADARLDAMHRVVRAKFAQNKDLKAKLLATGLARLEEGNYWHDRFWGVSPVGSGDGLNHLGQILMDVRHLILKESI